MLAINLDVNYFEHRKVKRLIALLGKGAEVVPLKLMAYVAKHHAETGRLTDYSPEELESLIDWWGKVPGECVAALVRVGFLEELRGGGWVLHGWLERSGHLAAFSQRASKAARARWDKAKGRKSSDAQASPSICPSNALPTHPPNPTTHPTLTEHAVRGAGAEKNGGNGVGEGNMTRAFQVAATTDDTLFVTQRMELTRLLQTIPLHAGSRKLLMARRDVTPERVKMELNDIRQDQSLTLDQVAAIFCSRFGLGKGKNK